MYLLSSSGPLTEMKCIPHSFATVEAIMVLPQPDGPYSITPERSRIGDDANSSGYLAGSSNISFNVFLT